MAPRATGLGGEVAVRAGELLAGCEFHGGQNGTAALVLDLGDAGAAEFEDAIE